MLPLQHLPGGAQHDRQLLAQRAQRTVVQRGSRTQRAVGRAHQFQHPGIGRQGAGEQLGTALHAILGPLHHLGLQAALTLDLLLPDPVSRLIVVERETDEQKRQQQAAKDEAPAGQTGDCAAVHVGMRTPGESVEEGIDHLPLDSLQVKRK